MLRRVALSLLMLMVLGVAAIVAAGHFGLPLPWHNRTAVHIDIQAPSKDSADNADNAEKTVDETAAALGGSTSTASPGESSVAIDISRISPGGTSVFAGRASPDSYVTVMEDGKPAGTVKADENGEWSLSTEHKFASADPQLTYEVSRTPPPAPAPPEQKKVAAASTTSSGVAGEVMRKFETLVEEAREEAKKAGTSAKASAPPGQDVVTATEPDVQPSPEETAPPVPDTAETLVPPAADQLETAGVKTDVIPVPIMFVYNEAKLTPEGQRAAALLLEYLNLKHFSVVELTGHADERGTDDYNYDLSRERLQIVSQLLKEGGFRGDLTLTPKGKSEPYKGVDRSAYSGEALYQLDRRVELRVTR